MALRNSPQPRWNPDRTILRQIAVKCAAAEQAQGPFGLIVGQSSAADAVWLENLQSTTGIKWLYLTVAGGTLERLLLALEPYFSSTLQPKIVVVALHPFSLRRRPVDPVEDLRALWLTQIEKLAFKVQRDCWSRARLPNPPKAEGAAAGPDGSDPFADTPQKTGPFDRHSANVQLKEWEADGVFQSDSYSGNSQQAWALTRLLEQLSQKSSRLVVVKVPEHSELRSKLPPQADQSMESAVGKRFPIVDLRKALSDECFVDLVHKNDLGRELLTPELARILPAP
jgi:hypothetical protein